MGGGQSALSKEEIFAQAKQYYDDNPEDFEDLYRKVKLEENNSTESSSSDVNNVRSYTSQEEGSFSKEIAEEMTLLRQNPPAYVTFIEQHLQNFQDDFTYKRENENILIKTKEGKKAVIECISVLKEQAPLPEVKPSEILEKAALDHQRDTSKNSLQGHTGSDGSTPQDRVQRHGLWQGKMGENIDYGNKTARDIIVALLIDDGVDSRGHRVNLLNPEFRIVGSAVGTHVMFTVCCVMNFATSIKPLDSIITDDCFVTCKGSITEEVINILESMPIETDQQISMINEKLAADMEVSISFKPSKKVTEFTFTKDGNVMTQTLSWGAE